MGLLPPLVWGSLPVKDQAGQCLTQISSGAYCPAPIGSGLRRSTSPIHQGVANVGYVILLSQDQKRITEENYFIFLLESHRPCR